MKFALKIEGRNINWEEYDSLFKKLKKQASRRNMAIYRLKYPIGLKKQAREVYKAYLLRREYEIIKNAAEHGDTETIGFMGDMGLISEKFIDDYIEASGRTGGQATGYLLNYKHKNFNTISKRFEL